jgi:hypothetical protein
MSFDTYANLQAEIADYCKRTSSSTFIAKIPGFITLCEADIGRKLRTWRMDSLETLTAVAGTQTVVLPTRIRAVKWLKLSGTFERVVTHLPAAAFFDLYGQQGASSAQTGFSQHYTYQEGNILLGPTPDDAYTLTALCTVGPVALSSTNPTNSLLTNYPDIYLYGAAVHGFRYLRNPERLAEAGQAFLSAIADANKESRKLRSSGTPDGVRSIGRRRIV